MSKIIQTVHGGCPSDLMGTSCGYYQKFVAGAKLIGGHGWSFSLPRWDSGTVLCTSMPQSEAWPGPCGIGSAHKLFLLSVWPCADLDVCFVLNQPWFIKIPKWLVGGF